VNVSIGDRRPNVSLATQYDEWHARVHDAEPSHPDEESPWYRLVLENLVSVQGKRILEVACGRGGFANLLASRGGIVSGADFSGTALQIAAGKHACDRTGQLDLTQADAENLPYADASFDVIVSCETIEHLANPMNSLREMARVCRHGGYLYLTTPNYCNAMGLYYLYARVRGRHATPGADQPFDRVFLFPQIRSMLRRARWKIKHSDGTVHQLPIRPGHNPVSLPFLEARRTIRRFLSPLALHYFVLAQKPASE
jgi:ubiquinone/menaquinone biosynthesis C-methylase UbiE